MDICSDGHDEIVYDGKRCPMCALIEEHKENINDLKAELEDANENINALHDEISDMRDGGGTP